MSRKNWESEKIFTRLLTNKTQKTFWDNIIELRKRPSNEVYNRAFELANSSDDKAKITGVYVLAQLGFNPRFKQKKTVNLYFKLLSKIQSSKVIVALLSSISHNNDKLTDRQIDQLLLFQNHRSSKVRYALVMSLLTVTNDKAIDALIKLSKDKDSDIRNWATFGLGSQIDITSTKIIAALWERINDTDEDTRLEAIVGLAKRKVVGVKKILINDLEKRKFETLLFDAILELNDLDLLPILQKSLLILKKSDDDYEKGWLLALEEVIEELKKV